MATDNTDTVSKKKAAAARAAARAEAATTKTAPASDTVSKKKAAAAARAAAATTKAAPASDTVSKKKAAAALAAAPKKKSAASAGVSKKKAPEAARRSAAFVFIDSDSIKSRSSAKLPFGNEFATLAMRWSNILSRRFRWEESSLDEIRKKAFVEIADLARQTKIKPVLKEASVVEVQIPFIDEATGWEARVIPWEFLISNAAIEFGNQNPLVIVRHLKTGAKVVSYKVPPKVLYVQCAPGKLGDLYSYESEKNILAQVFSGRVEECINPTLAELRKAIVDYEPNVIHLAGIDSNQARLEVPELTGGKRVSSKDKDGIAFRSNNARGFILIGAENLAGVLNAGASPIFLVTANVLHSASRICSLAVAEGAHLAVGFQDTINDAVAEIFLREFYAGWSREMAPLPAFSGALDVVRDTISLSGAGIVLWSAHPLINRAQQLSEYREERRCVRSEVIEKKKLDDFRDWFKPEIEVKKELNFSMLHNNSGGLFDKFLLIKEEEGLLYDVGIEATLFLGPDVHAYRSRCTLTHRSTPIEELIKVPLTSDIIRTVSEPLRTSLFVEVTIGDRIAHQETYQVTLNPADQWADTETDRVWLPSFVLPRDPFVEKIIDRAEKHLVTLTDNRSAAFDGYQKVAWFEGLDRYVSVVDPQVQAIWASIVFDFGIGYINPPPSHSGQRLRTPSQIEGLKRGTCIDLALLFAACLEYFDIHPVIFLYVGHAFVGYWRSEDYYNQFKEGTADGGDESDKKVTGRQDAPWVFFKESFAEIKKAVDEGCLVPLETVELTDEGKFSQAKEKGRSRLEDARNFNALIDISLARSKSISPLPIIDIHS